MRQTVYISLSVCLLAFSACGDDVSSPQVEESCILHPDFRPEGLLSIQASTGGRAALQTENGEAGNVGVCITAGNSHLPYLSGGVSRYTFTTGGTGYEGTGTGADPMPPLYLTNKSAVIQAFHPSAETVTESGVSDYTIPVTISSAQSFLSTADGDKLQCVTTDYLYGSAGNGAGDATPVHADNTHASPAIYMHHALAKVVFTLQCDDNRTPNAACDCVKSIRMTAAGGTPFPYGAGTMQIKDGTLAGLSVTDELTFTPAGGTAPVAVGVSGNPSTVACGLAAPLSGTPGNITLAVTLGKDGETTYDRTYTATNTAFNVQWQKGYCYTYNLVLGNDLTVQQVTTTWTGTSAGDIPAVTPKEKGISDLNELAAFAAVWNANGLAKKGDGTFDYSPYEPYGWYEKDDKGNRVFTIKITNSFIILKDVGSTWVPIGNDAHPLTLPVDGQGWQVTLDFSNGRQTVADGNMYAGIIGYTRSSISNVRIVCSFSAGSGATADSNFLESGDATYTGILAGKSEGDITNCTVEMEGTTLLSQPSGTPKEVYMGGLVGYCSQNISNCAVYEAYNRGATLKTAPAATSTINMGALAGKVEGTVNNCYTCMGNLHKEEPATTTNSTVNAGWLTGSGNSFAGSHYHAGTATDCTPADYSSVTGVQSMTGLTGLCTALNADLGAHPLWTRWTEKKDPDTDLVTSVFLFDYRNKK